MVSLAFPFTRAMSLTTITRTPPLPSTGVIYVVRHRARGMEAEPKPQMIVHHLPTELFSTRNEASNRVRQGNRDTIAGRCEIILQRLLLFLVCIRDEGSNSPFRRAVSDTTAEPDAAIIILHLHPFPRWARCEMSRYSVPTPSGVIIQHPTSGFLCPHPRTFSS
jgi:hypothetical protein